MENINGVLVDINVLTFGEAEKLGLSRSEFEILKGVKKKSAKVKDVKKKRIRKPKKINKIVDFEEEEVSENDLEEAIIEHSKSFIADELILEDIQEAELQKIKKMSE